MLAKEHGIVPRNLVFEDRVSLIRVAESACAIELPLNTTEVAGVAGIFIGARLLAEIVVRHVFDGIEPEAVGF